LVFIGEKRPNVPRLHSKETEKAALYVNSFQGVTNKGFKKSLIRMGLGKPGNGGKMLGFVKQGRQPEKGGEKKVPKNCGDAAEGGSLGKKVREGGKKNPRWLRLESPWENEPTKNTKMSTNGANSSQINKGFGQGAAKGKDLSVAFWGGSEV